MAIRTSVPWPGKRSLRWLKRNSTPAIRASRIKAPPRARDAWERSTSPPRPTSRQTCVRLSKMFVGFFLNMSFEANHVLGECKTACDEPHTRSLHSSYGRGSRALDRASRDASLRRSARAAGAACRGAKRRGDPRCRPLPRASARLHQGAALRAWPPADGRGLVPDARHRGHRDGPRRPGHLPRPGAARRLPDLRPRADERRCGRLRPSPRARDDRRARRLRDPRSGVRRPHGRLDRGRSADGAGRGRPPANACRRGHAARRRRAEDRLDRHPRERGRDDARARDQREQRPPAVRVDHPLRDRPRAHDLRRPRTGARGRHGRVRGRGAGPARRSAGAPAGRAHAGELGAVAA